MYYSLRIVGGNVLSCNKKLITYDMHHTFLSRYFTLYCGSKSFKSLKALHLSCSTEMLRYSGYQRLLRYVGCVLIRLSCFCSLTIECCTCSVGPVWCFVESAGSSPSSSSSSSLLQEHALWASSQVRSENLSLPWEVTVSSALWWVLIWCRSRWIWWEVLWHGQLYLKSSGGCLRSYEAFISQGSITLC